MLHVWNCLLCDMFFIRLPRSKRDWLTHFSTFLLERTEKRLSLKIMPINKRKENFTSQHSCRYKQIGVNKIHCLIKNRFHNIVHADRWGNYDVLGREFFRSFVYVASRCWISVCILIDMQIRFSTIKDITVTLLAHKIFIYFSL